MMKWSVLMILSGLAFQGFSQDYLIGFESAGSTVDSVRIDNMTQGKTLVISGSDVLHLKARVTGSYPLAAGDRGKIAIYPNPSPGSGMIGFDMPAPGMAVLRLSDISGREIVRFRQPLAAGRHSFLAEGFRAGLYLIELISGNTSATGKWLCTATEDGHARVHRHSMVPEDQALFPLKSTLTVRMMQYTTGDILKYTFFSGNRLTVMTDIPVQSKTISAVFHTCAAPGGGNYSIIKIGEQWWMAENLRYLPEVSPPDTGSETARHYYVYGYSGSDTAAAKATSAYKTLGALYNWPAAMNGSASGDGNPGSVQGACPQGWHLPGNDEWGVLVGFLNGNLTAGGKMKEQGLSHWTSPNTGAVNESGFTALPGGYRGTDGIFSGSGVSGNWWSSAEQSIATGWYLNLVHSSSSAERLFVSKGNAHSVRCIKNMAVPVLVTKAAAAITTNSALLGGIITADGGFTVTDRGVCWGTSPYPVISGPKQSMGVGTGEFKGTVSGMAENTTYYARAYAVNSQGIAYGAPVMIITSQGTGTGTFTDPRDAKIYKWTKIGNQFWMAENLAWLPSVSPSDQGSATEKRYYVYGYNGTDPQAAKAANSFKTYGVLYNWPAAMDGTASSNLNPSGIRGACPAGWHLPADPEWEQLALYISDTKGPYGKTNDDWADVATHLKARSGWYTGMGQGNGTDDFNFSALPGGTRDQYNKFSYTGENGYWWSSTEDAGYTQAAWYRLITFFSGYYNRMQTYKPYGKSIRCVKDN